MAKRCTSCGFAYNPDNEGRCTMCDQPLGTGSASASPQPSRVIPEAASMMPSTGEPPRSPRGSSPVAGLPSGQPPASLETPPAREASRHLEGRITNVELHDERQPNDIYRILSRVMIGILIVVPYAIFFVGMGVLSIVFGFLRFHGLAQFFNPIAWTTAIFELMEVIVLRNLRGSDTLPVYRGTVEDSSGTEQHFMMMGPLIGGNLTPGQRVRLTGNWRRGTLRVMQGEDVSARTAITTDYRNRWRAVFYVMVGIYSALSVSGLWYYFHILPG